MTTQLNGHLLSLLPIIFAVMNGPDPVTGAYSTAHTHTYIHTYIHTYRYLYTCTPCRCRYAPGIVCNGVCVGHHEGDLQENVISNMMKGGSLLDLAGMGATSGKQYGTFTGRYGVLCACCCCVPTATSLALSACLRVCVSACVSGCLPAYLSVWPSVRPSVRPSVCLSVCLSVCKSVSQSVSQPVSVCLCLRLPL